MGPSHLIMLRDDIKILSYAWSSTIVELKKTSLVRVGCSRRCLLILGAILFGLVQYHKHITSISYLRSIAYVDNSPPPHVFERLKDVRPRPMTLYPTPLPAGAVSLKGGEGKPPHWCTESALSGIGAITTEEATLLSKYVRGAAGYFETGIGSSSIRAMASPVLKEFTLVDAADGALACVLNHPVTQAFAKRDGNKLNAVYVDIDGDPNNWGKPTPRSNKVNWPTLSDIILYHPNPEVFDVVLVDGRFRASCIMKAASVVRDDAVIIVHDYERPEYHVGIESGVLWEVERAGSLVVLQRTIMARKIDEDPVTAKQKWKDLWEPVAELSY